IVEALTAGRKEISVGIPESKVPGSAGVSGDIAIAKLGKNDFQRTAKTVEHANAILQRDHFCRLDRLMWRIVDGKREPCLRIVRMNQEGRAAFDIGLEQLHALVG